MRQRSLNSSFYLLPSMRVAKLCLSFTRGRGASSTTGARDSSSCACLETNGYNATSPDRIAVDFFVHQPGSGFVRRVQCHRRVVTPALDAGTRVEVAGQECGTGETSRPGCDLGICAQLARYAHLCIDSYTRIGRRPSHETVACGVGRDGCVEVIRRPARGIESALLESVGRGVDTVEKRRGRTKRVDGVRLPQVSPILGARIHKSRIRSV